MVLTRPITTWLWARRGGRTAAHACDHANSEPNIASQALHMATLRVDVELIDRSARYTHTCTPGDQNRMTHTSEHAADVCACEDSPPPARPRTPPPADLLHCYRSYAA
ncbi:hypothetical protein KGM_205185 [Danaus plexippus plexippus]|uniref:Uncharacterized protein n=1 Tax=Danaus plexippus plexippus TaxID=278856 RepID=A0A212EY38_DANPL|nr:hypothetical protein KGM_205185 [Danaus plexippus plexippus]